LQQNKTDRLKSDQRSNLRRSVNLCEYTQIPCLYYYKFLLRCPTGHDQADYLCSTLSLQGFGTDFKGPTGHK